MEVSEFQSILGFGRFLNSMLFIVGLAHPTSKPIYNQTDQKIEKYIEILKTLLLILTPIGVLIPLFIVGCISFFTTQMGDDAFVSPFPSW